MGELINVNIIPENGVMTTSSKDVSLHFDKQHSHVLRDIDLLKKIYPILERCFLI